MRANIFDSKVIFIDKKYAYFFPFNFDGFRLIFANVTLLTNLDPTHTLRPHFVLYTKHNLIFKTQAKHNPLDHFLSK